MTNEEETTLTARYLIEDNDSEYLYYDENVKGELIIVKSILKKMIGHLPPWNEDRVRKIHDEVSEVYILYSLLSRIIRYVSTTTALFVRT